MEKGLFVLEVQESGLQFVVQTRRPQLMRAVGEQEKHVFGDLLTKGLKIACYLFIFFLPVILPGLIADIDIPENIKKQGYSQQTDRISQQLFQMEHKAWKDLFLNIYSSNLLSSL